MPIEPVYEITTPREKAIRASVHGCCTYLLTDYQYWAKHEEELQIWLDDNTEKGRDLHQGMTISFTNANEELLFALRWL